MNNNNGSKLTLILINTKTSFHKNAEKHSIFEDKRVYNRFLYYKRKEALFTLTLYKPNYNFR